MSGPEARAWASVRSRLQTLQTDEPNLHWQRIESGSTTSGIFDLNVCFGGVETWIELKSVQMPKRVQTIPNPLSDHQRAWGVTRMRAGGRTYCLVQLRIGIVASVWRAWSAAAFYDPEWMFSMNTLANCLLLRPDRSRPDGKVLLS